MRRFLALCTALAVLWMLTSSASAAPTRMPCDKSRVISPVTRITDETGNVMHGIQQERPFGIVRAAYNWAGRKFTVFDGVVRLSHPVHAIRLKIKYLVCQHGKLKTIGHFWRWRKAGSEPITEAEVLSPTITDRNGSFKNLVRRGLWLEARIRVSGESVTAFTIPVRLAAALSSSGS